MVNIRQDRYTKDEIPNLGIEKDEDRYPFTFRNKGKTIELKFFGKSISFKWWF